MKDEILRVLNKMEEMKWITINPQLNKNALASTFIDMLKDMKLSTYLSMFKIDWL